MTSTYVDLSLTPDISVDTDIELPGVANDNTFYYPGAVRNGGHVGLFIRITAAEGQPFICGFAGGTSRTAQNRVIGLPDEHSICVVVEGRGYIIDAKSPETWESVAIMPVIDAVVSQGTDIVILSSFSDLIAYDSNGIAWKINGLVWDELVVRELTQESLAVTGWDAPSNSLVNAKIDVRSGAILSGIGR